MDDRVLISFRGGATPTLGAIMGGRPPAVVIATHRFAMEAILPARNGHLIEPYLPAPCQRGRRHGLERVLAAALMAVAAGTLVRSLALPGPIWIGAVVLSKGIAVGSILLVALVQRDFPNKAGGLIGLDAAAMAGMAGIAPSWSCRPLASRNRADAGRSASGCCSRWSGHRSGTRRSVASA